MKKFLIILLSLCACILPNTVFAKSYKFNYTCDGKQPLGDGTFYMNCHIAITTDFDINHIEGNLILKNVKLESIKTKGDWTNNNGLSSSVSFTSTSSHSGTIAIADLVFTGDVNAPECEASFNPVLVELKKQPDPTPDPEPIVCAIVDNEFYGKNGTKVTDEKYYEECCNYTCTIVDNKYYFNSQGKSVSYDKFMEDCSTTPDVPNPVPKPDPTIPDSPATGIDYGYIILPIGIISIIAIIKIAKKNTKIYKI